jgi:hypothetical protein
MPKQKGAIVADPAAHIQILGKGFATRDHAPVLVIGKYSWNRWSLGRLGCPHPVAAANLNRVVQQLGITTLNNLADRAHEIGTFTGLGVTAYWTVLAILESAGYDVQRVHAADVTYHTMKAQDVRRQAAARTTKRKRIAS